MTFPGYRQAPSLHCWTGSLRNIYSFHEQSISEEMLLGIGEGVGYIYWHTKGILPFIGGRTNVERPGKDGLVKLVGQRTGVYAEMFCTNSSKKAEKHLLSMLEASQPVMLVLDMGFLPYFDFGGEDFHFGSHVVVVCGYEKQSGLVLLADRDDNLHPVSLEDLAKARGSKFKPFPPKHTWFEFDFNEARYPKIVEVEDAISACAAGMLNPPISNFGIRAIYKTAERILTWPDMLSPEDLRLTCINTAIMIKADGGSGGGLFRFMYANFLDEVSILTNNQAYAKTAEFFRLVGNEWEWIAGRFKQAFQEGCSRKLLQEIHQSLLNVAEKEEKIWHSLQQRSNMM